MSSMINAIKIAYDKGYRVLEDGTLIGLKGNKLKVKKRGKQRYPTFSVNVGNLTNSGVYGVPVHKFAAYCFYGYETFKDGIVVRHMNGNTEDVSIKNIKLGTHSDNNLDKPKEVRRRAARTARLSQGRPMNRKFEDHEVMTIRKRLSSGESLTDIAKEFGVTKQCIYLIKVRRNYANVQ